MTYVSKSSVELTVFFQALRRLSEVHKIQRLLFLEVTDEVAFLRIQLFQFFQTLDNLDRIPDLLLHKLREGFGRPLAAILPLGQLTVPNVLERGILGDVEFGAKCSCRE